MLTVHYHNKAVHFHPTPKFRLFYHSLILVLFIRTLKKKIINFGFFFSDDDDDIVIAAIKNDDDR